MFDQTFLKKIKLFLHIGLIREYNHEKIYPETNNGRRLDLKRGICPSCSSSSRCRWAGLSERIWKFNFFQNYTVICFYGSIWNDIRGHIETRLPKQTQFTRCVTRELQEHKHKQNSEIAASIHGDIRFITAIYSTSDSLSSSEHAPLPSRTCPNT